MPGKRLVKIGQVYECNNLYKYKDYVMDNDGRRYCYAREPDPRTYIYRSHNYIIREPMENEETDICGQIVKVKATDTRKAYVFVINVDNKGYIDAMVKREHIHSDGRHWTDIDLFHKESENTFLNLLRSENECTIKTVKLLNEEEKKNAINELIKFIEDRMTEDPEGKVV